MNRRAETQFGRIEEFFVYKCVHVITPILKLHHVSALLCYYIEVLYITIFSLISNVIHDVSIL